MAFSRPRFLCRKGGPEEASLEAPKTGQLLLVLQRIAPHALAVGQNQFRADQVVRRESKSRCERSVAPPKRTFHADCSDVTLPSEPHIREVDDKAAIP